MPRIAPEPSARPAVSRSRQNYLKALLQLGAGGAVSVSVLARRLGVSAPSVTNMLARLDEERLVELGPRGAARLTASGERAASLVLRRHRLLETFLARVLELDWSEVHVEAEELEHFVSERVIDAIERCWATRPRTRTAILSPTARAGCRGARCRRSRRSPRARGRACARCGAARTPRGSGAGSGAGSCRERRCACSRPIPTRACSRWRSPDVAL